MMESRDRHEVKELHSRDKARALYQVQCPARVVDATKTAHQGEEKGKVHAGRRGSWEALDRPMPPAPKEGY